MKRTMSFLIALVVAISVCGCGETPSLSESEATISESEVSVDSTVSEETQTASVSEITEPEPEVEPEPEIEEMYIKELFAEHGIKAGTCLSSKMTADPKLQMILKGQFNSITLENAMKPEAILNKEKSIEAGDIVVEFSDETVKLLDWAKKNELSARGHTLVWYSQTPNWIFYEGFDGKNELVGRDEMLARMDSYIRQVFELLDEYGYTDMFYAYDVVNEAVMDDGKLRDTTWKKIIGDDYIWWAFYYADKYAPESIDLYYNDFNEQFKTDAEIKLVESLVDDTGRSLIDGIGLQAHLYTSDDMLAYFDSIDKFGATGLKVELTELDVCLGAYQRKLPNNEENQMLQGRYYYNLINGLLERKDNGTVNLDAITFWGISDNLSWRSDQYPLLYNIVMKPKYSYYGVMQKKELAGF